MQSTFARPIKCPECRGEYAHLVRVEILQNRDLVSVDKNGAHSITSEALSGRGSRVMIYFSGECGHQWCGMYQFHKGSTYFDSFRIDDPSVKDGSLFAVDGLWRD